MGAPAERLSEELLTAENIIEVARCPMCASTKRSLRWVKGSKYVQEPARIFECSSCSFIYSGDTLDGPGLKNFYEQKYQSGNYVSYTTVRALKEAQIRSRYELIKRVTGKSTGRVLDVGCGEGISVDVAHDLGFEVVGVELSAEAASLAKQSGKGTIFCAPLEELPNLRIGTFDLIVGFDVFDHLLNAQEIARHAAGLLRPGGSLYMEVCNIESLYATVMGKNYTHLIAFEHLGYFSLKTLEALNERVGLETKWCGNVSRKVSLEFLLATFREFNPLLYRLGTAATAIFPERLKKKYWDIPVGIIASIATKRESARSTGPVRVL